jgi:uncharacterized protein YbjT (DUF2867 family)
MILVCGATGTVGGEVLRLLCESATPTRALVRSPEKADLLRGMSVTLGKQVRYVDAGPAEARAGMLAYGMDAWLVDGLMEL